MSTAARSNPHRNQLSPAVAVFARSPVPGRAKTRLIPLLGARGAAELQAALVLDITRKLNQRPGNAARWFFLAGNRHPRYPWRDGWILRKQHGRDLGERLHHAFREMLRRHRRAIVIGTDSPLLSSRHLRQALTELNVCDSVLGPCPDGGFYLLGLREIPRNLFRGVRWGSCFAFQDMLRNLLSRGLVCSVLPAVPDVDRGKDLIALAGEMARRPALRKLAPEVWRTIKRTRKTWRESR